MRIPLVHWRSFGIGLALSCVLISATYGTIVSFSRQAAIDALDTWREASANAIYEGNILSAISDHRRILMSSSFVYAIKIIDVEATVHRDLAAYGDDLEIPFDLARDSSGQTFARSIGLFNYVASHRLAERPGIAVLFGVQPRYATLAFAALTVIFLVAIYAAIALASHIRRREAARRFELAQRLVKVALADERKDVDFEEARKLVPELGDAFEALRLEVSKLRQALVDRIRDAAIARTAQMLAHDVRKPFQILGFVQRRIAGVSSVAELRAVTGPAFIELDRAKAAIEGMLADLLTVNSAVSTVREVATLEQILDETLGGARYASGLSRVEITYRLEHRGALLVDKARVVRVFTNLVGNAIEAMGGHGAMWLASRVVEGPMIEVTVGNAGSFIPEDKRAAVFDVFFTSGKKGGTGLGLAIAKKVVADHGGEIHCHSDEARGTEFVLTLPVSPVASVKPAGVDLPALLVPPVIAEAAAANSPPVAIDAPPTAPERRSAAATVRPLVVLVDDNPVFLGGWEIELAPHAETLGFASIHAAEEAIARDGGILERAVAFILDEHYEGQTETGRDLALRLRRQYAGCIALATSDPAACSVAPGVDAVWDKDDVCWPELQELMRVRAQLQPPSARNDLLH